MQKTQISTHNIEQFLAASAQSHMPVALVQSETISMPMLQMPGLPSTNLARATL